MKKVVKLNEFGSSLAAAKTPPRSKALQKIRANSSKASTIRGKSMEDPNGSKRRKPISTTSARRPSRFASAASAKNDLTDSLTKKTQRSLQNLKAKSVDPNVAELGSDNAAEAGTYARVVFR